MTVVRLMKIAGLNAASRMTMKRLKAAAILEISEVVQVKLPHAPDITEEAVDEVLDGVRPFLSVAGGSIDLVSVSGSGGIQPTVVLKLEGKSASLFSVKNEIRAHPPPLHGLGACVEWDGATTKNCKTGPKQHLRPGTSCAR